MKKIKIAKPFVAFMLLLIFVFYSGTPSFAQTGKNWYFIKRGNDTPSFPSDAEYLATHQCYFVDSSVKGQAEKILYLTFDAGYENGNIEKILDILKEKRVKGAFFVLSNLIVKNTDLIIRMVNEGHIVANHTKNHKDLTKLSDSEIEANLKALECLYEEKTGLSMSKYFRFPEGRYNEDTVLLLEKLGYKTIFWSMAHADWDDNKQPNENIATQKLLSCTHPGAVILLHPTSRTNVEILPELIDEWQKEGYTFGTLDMLIENMGG